MIDKRMLAGMAAELLFLRLCVVSVRVRYRVFACTLFFLFREKKLNQQSLFSDCCFSLFTFYRCLLFIECRHSMTKKKDPNREKAKNKPRSAQRGKQKAPLKPLRTIHKESLFDRLGNPKTAFRHITLPREFPAHNLISPFEF